MKPDDPGIVIVLSIAGWVMIGISALTLLFSVLAMEDSVLINVSASVGGTVLGLGLLGFSTALQKLCQIEYRLKRLEPKPVETSEQN